MGHLNNIDEEKNHKPMNIQMLIQQAVLQQRELCQNKWNWTPLNYLTPNPSQTLKPSLRHSERV